MRFYWLGLGAYADGASLIAWPVAAALTPAYAAEPLKITILHSGFPEPDADPSAHRGPAQSLVCEHSRTATD